PVGVVDEEPSILGIVGMESQAEQPPLTASRYLVADVEERLIEQVVTGRDPYPLRLLEDEEARITRRAGEKHRLRQALEHRSRLDCRLGHRGPGQGEAGGQDC